MLVVPTSLSCSKICSGDATVTASEPATVPAVCGATMCTDAVVPCTTSTRCSTVAPEKRTGGEVGKRQRRDATRDAVDGQGHPWRVARDLQRAARRRGRRRRHHELEP